MIDRKQIGNKGEDLAVNFLFANGYEVVHRNYRIGRAEIDIIAKNDDTLIFIEVKTRKNADYGYPESFVSTGQQERLHYAAELYAEQKKWRHDIRFDVLAILWDGASDPQLEHFEDAF